jgi:hypothetical protein
LSGTVAVPRHRLLEPARQPVDLEQREGRVHRYKGHAIRKNVAAEYGQAALGPESCAPGSAVFVAAQAGCSDGDSDIKPFWIFTRPGGAVIERYVPPRFP